jgi:hypothetical protein
MAGAQHMSAISGGCQCGALRYRISAALGEASICHCRMCQKAFGSWGAALVAVPLESFAWTRGSPATFKSSPIVDRGFCSACGTPLFIHEAGGYPSIEIAIGTLDDPNAVTLSHQTGVESRVHWFGAMADLPAETTEQNRSAADLAKLNSLQHPDYDTDEWPPKSA